MSGQRTPTNSTPGVGGSVGPSIEVACDEWFEIGAPREDLTDSEFYTSWMAGTQGQRGKAMRYIRDHNRPADSTYNP